MSDEKSSTGEWNGHSAKEWSLALQSLTPQGSEFACDPKACVDIIRREREDTIRLRKTMARVCSENEQLKAQLSDEKHDRADLEREVVRLGTRVQALASHASDEEIASINACEVADRQQYRDRLSSLEAQLAALRERHTRALEIATKLDRAPGIETIGNWRGAIEVLRAALSAPTQHVGEKPRCFRCGSTTISHLEAGCSLDTPTAPEGGDDEY